MNQYILTLLKRRCKGIAFGRHTQKIASRIDVTALDRTRYTVGESENRTAVAIVGVRFVVVAVTDKEIIRSVVAAARSSILVLCIVQIEVKLVGVELLDILGVVGRYHKRVSPTFGTGRSQLRGLIGPGVRLIFVNYGHRLTAVIVRHHQRRPVVALESDRISLGSFVRPVVVLRTSDESYRSRSQQSQKYSFFHNLLLFNKLYVSSCTKDRRKAYASGAHGNTGSGKID